MTKYICKGCESNGRTCEITVREGRGNHATPPDCVNNQRCLYSINEENRIVRWVY
jgi:hypothetical protein